MMLTLKMFTKKLILLILTIGFCQSALGQIEKAELVTFFVNERDRLQESILFAQQNTSLEVLQTSQRERLREAWFLFLNHHGIEVPLQKFCRNISTKCQGKADCRKNKNHEPGKEEILV